MPASMMQGSMMPEPKMPGLRVGVLALQGGVAEHLGILNLMPGVTASRVLDAEQLAAVDGLIIPGGESSAVGILLDTDERGRALKKAIMSRIASGMPVWGTCMGAILLARQIENDSRTHLAVMDINVRRNAYGSQLDSFTAVQGIVGVDGGAFPLVFIRAPVIVSAGKGVEVLARYGDSIVACRQGNCLASTFHPELTADPRFHGYFMRMVAEYAATPQPQ